MSKKKSKKKSNITTRIRENARSIFIVVVLIAIFSSISFYLGMSTPSSYSIPINLTSSMTLSLQYDTTLHYGPAHTGVRVSFEVTTASHSWTVDIRDIDGNPLDVLSSSSTGTFATANWLYAPEGCIIMIHSSTSFPTQMDLVGTLTITSSRFPFI